ncbi:hypothetical protein HOU41_gp121 [Proteus phage Stubb]|uniref:Uncharacterized protein n=1 Tax=Proteus phage Stubb TaxID=2315597 RepID=A0A3B8DJ39_9CAUD|nr:hypothetical protein HOU41_gp121 [Proteus phage Stubb]AYJ73223.1 hypothetical protein CPT_Stubb_107 [Proteus phage Stubb]
MEELTKQEIEQVMADMSVEEQAHFTQHLQNLKALKRRTDRAMLGSKHPKERRTVTITQVSDRFSGLTKIYKFLARAVPSIDTSNATMLRVAESYGL